MVTTGDIDVMTWQSAYRGHFLSYMFFFKFSTIIHCSVNANLKKIQETSNEIATLNNFLMYDY